MIKFIWLLMLALPARDHPGDLSCPEEATAYRTEADCQQAAKVVGQHVWAWCEKIEVK